MSKESDFTTLAEQAERLSAEVSNAHLASNWGQMALGFRELARLHAAAKRACSRRLTSTLQQSAPHEATKDLSS